MFNAHCLKKRRQQAGLTQGELAERIGKSQGYIGDLERGDRRGLTVTTLERLADVLGCTTDELLGRSTPAVEQETTERGASAARG
jgi:transcriptional regulator with XRE-family HTH domain